MYFVFIILDQVFNLQLNVRKFKTMIIQVTFHNKEIILKIFIDHE